MKHGNAFAASLLIVAAAGAATLAVDDPDRPEASRAREAIGRPPRGEAVSAATRFLVGLDAATLLDTRSRRRHVARWAARGAESSLQRLLAAEAALLSPLADGFTRAGLLGYRVPRLSPRAARVDVWAVSIAVVRGAQPAIGMRTVSVTVAREAGEWKVARVEERSVPSLHSAPEAFREHAERFREYRVAP